MRKTKQTVTDQFETLGILFNKFSTQNCRRTKTTKPALAFTKRLLCMAANARRPSRDESGYRFEAAGLLILPGKSSGNSPRASRIQKA
jgi:hypothetical protein